MSTFIQSINVFDIDISNSKLKSKQNLHFNSPSFIKKKHSKGFSFSLDKHIKQEKQIRSQKKSVYINNVVQRQILDQIQPFKDKIKNISSTFKMDQNICFQFVNKILNGLGVQCESEKKQKQKQKNSSTFLPNSYKKMQRLQQLLIQKQYQISLLQQKLDYYKNQVNNFNKQKQNSQIFTNIKLLQTDIKLNINPSQSLQQNLYHQAKILKLPQFIQLCDNILLKHKPSITNIHSLKSQQLQKTNLFLKQIHQKVFLIGQNLLHLNAPNSISLSKTIVGKTNKTISQQIQEITSLLMDLNRLHNLNSLIFTCTQPCCRMKDVSDQRINKAKLIMQLKQNPKKNNFYKTDFSDQYFHRYYKGANFDETKIFSIQKTKTEQMEHLETLYKKRKSKTRHMSNLQEKQAKSTFQI